MATKQAQLIEVKDADQGVVLAKFATLGMKDHDGDLIEDGAIGEQRMPVSAYGHTSWEGSLPVGVGRTFERHGDALAELQFFMDTRHGRDHFETIKGLGSLGEYSFGFGVLDSADPTEEERREGIRRVLKRLKVYEISPVLRGAGIGTGTMSAKCVSCGTPTRAASKRTTSCGCSTSAPPPDAQAVLLRARETHRRLEYLGSKGSRYVPRGPGYQRLAEFVAAVGYKLTGPGRHVGPPAVKWFPQAMHPRDAAFVFGVLNETWVSNDLPWTRVAQAVLHEAMHHKQEDPLAPGAEASADAFADVWKDAVLGAYAATDGDPSRVVHRKTRPPWYDVAPGSVVLHAGAYYTSTPLNAGPSWTRRAA